MIRVFTMLMRAELQNLQAGDPIAPQDADQGGGEHAGAGEHLAGHWSQVCRRCDRAVVVAGFG